MTLLEDSAQAPASALADAIPLSRIVQHFKDRYSEDITDVNTSMAHYDTWIKANGLSRHRGDPEVFNRYLSDPTGKASCPLYFNFRHFCLDIGRDIPWEYDAKTDRRWKIVPLPLAAEAAHRAEQQMEVFARILSMAKARGLETTQVELPSVGGEAVDILNRIEADFGPGVAVLID